MAGRRASMGVTPSASSTLRSLRSTRRTPSTHASSVVGRDVLQRAIEVVEHGQQLADQQRVAELTATVARSSSVRRL